MEAENRPCAVIALCDAEGALRPLRFRFEDGAHRLHTVSVTEVTDTRRETFVGMEQLAFLCRARVDGREALYELKYTVSTHRWVLFRRIY
ncbi:MAG TPA: hypothetical protein IAA70_08375 [Candidatus Avoscillospira stercoripullorum]|uniref:Uncharacterized protein n=1 Tax=Candidatus Avoscillospira stercoripullorum TaxID=2840709 RepID=A0A9D1D7V0_9FIRM|nr:hypothetical protein [Candidatus Avoscillospira stercoripullorum]